MSSTRALVSSLRGAAAASHQSSSSSSLRRCLIAPAPSSRRQFSHLPPRRNEAKTDTDHNDQQAASSSSSSTDEHQQRSAEASFMDSLFGPSDDLPEDAQRTPSASSSSNEHLQMDREDPFASLFDSPDPFPKTELPSRGPEHDMQRRASRRTRDLDSNPYRNRYGTKEALTFVHRRSQDRNTSLSRLSPDERQQWMKILGDVQDITSIGDGDKNKKMASWATRNHLDADLRARRRKLGGNNAKRLAALQEGISADVSPEDLERGVDAAKQEMDSRGNEADVWIWAVRNVWGVSEDALEHVAKDSAAQGKESKDMPTMADKVHFGADTPFYAPVLHRLLVHFRDRLKSPHSALSVLRITRALSPESLVLGCTPEIYAEALKTMYFWMKDLRGCLSLLQEARDLGFLSDIASASDNGRNADAQTTAYPDSVPGIVQRIQTDVSRNTLGLHAALQAKSSKQAPTDTSASVDFDSDSDLFTRDLESELFRDPNQDQDKKEEAQVDLRKVNPESLSLPALDALSLVEEMNGVLNSVRRQRQGRELELDELDSEWDVPSSSSRAPRGNTKFYNNHSGGGDGGGGGKGHSHGYGHRRTTMFYPKRRHQREPILGPKPWLRPSSHQENADLPPPPTVE